jgi:hypothetical protein
MSKSIEDILVCIHDEHQDEHAKLGRMVREVSAHLVPFGHYTSTERVRIARALRDKNLETQLSDRIADIIHPVRVTRGCRVSPRHESTRAPTPRTWRGIVAGIRRGSREQGARRPGIRTYGGGR